MESTFFKIISFLRDFIWGVPLSAVLFGCGIYLAVKSGFYPFRRLTFACKTVFGNLSGKDKGGISPFAALSTALGGTVGIGSIVGVAYALEAGGPGALFWMWVSGFFCLFVKYAECALAVKHRELKENKFVGGPMYIFASLGKKKLATLFSCTVIASSLLTGSVTQTNAAFEMMKPWHIPDIVIAIFFALTAYATIAGGQRKIGKANALIMPAASLIYIALTLLILIRNRLFIGNALYDVVQSAFGARQMSSGIGGTAMIVAFRTGFSKGIFSNEAGMGSSPIAHASSDGASPEIQGLWGMFEVFFDTFIVSTLTALAMLSGGFTDIGEMFFACFGDAGLLIFIILTVVFAFAAMLSWCFYAESGIAYLTDKKSVLIIFRIIFAITVYLAVFARTETVWITADLMNGAMVFQNTFLIIIQRKNVLALIPTIERCKKKRKSICSSASVN